VAANDSVARLLLQIEGENLADDDLARLQGQLAAFGGTKAEATAEVEAKGEGDLAALAAQLELFDDTDAEATARINTRGLDRDERRLKAAQLALFEWAQGLKSVGADVGDDTVHKEVVVDVHKEQLTLLNEQLRLFDGEHVEATADVNTLLGSVKLANLHRKLREFGAIRAKAEADVDPDGRAQGALGRLFTGFKTLALGEDAAHDTTNRLRGSFGVFSGLTFQTTVAVYALVAALGVALVSALAAVAASAAAAIAALGAIAVAAGGAGGALAAMIGFAIFRFKDLSKKGGQVAQELSRAFKQTGAELARELSPAARPIFRALTAELRNIRPFIQGLREPFMALGGSIAAAIKIGADEVKQLIPNFRALLFSAAPIAPLLAQGFGAFAGILLNIANVAMPYLISGLTQVVGWLRQFQQFTATQEFADDVEVLVGHLKSWLNLGWQISRVFLEFFKAAAPLGKDLVDSMAEGVKHWADWIAAHPDEVRSFLSEMIGVTRELWNTFKQLVNVVVQFSRAVGPALMVALPIITILLGMFAQLLSWINSLPGPLRLVASMFLLFLGPIGFIRVLISILRLLALTLLGPVIGAIARVGVAFAAMAAGLIARAIGIGAAIGTSLGAGLLSRIGFLGAALRAALPAMLVGARAFGIVGAAITSAIANGIFISGASSIGGALGRVWEVISLGGPLTVPLLLFRAFGKSLTAEIGKGLAAGAGAIKNSFSNNISNIIGQSWTEANQVTAKGVADIAAQIESGAKRFAGGIQRGMSGAVKQAEAGAQQIADGILKGLSNSARDVQQGATRIAAAAARGLASGRAKALAAGQQTGQGYGAGIGGAGPAVAAAAQRLAGGAGQQLHAGAASAHAAGVSLGTMFANGITSTLGAVVAGARKIAAAARAQLPGSEPDDPGSPLRGLIESGAQIPKMLAEGVLNSGPELVRAVRAVASDQRKVMAEDGTWVPQSYYDNVSNAFNAWKRYRDRGGSMTWSEWKRHNSAEASAASSEVGKALVRGIKNAGPGLVLALDNLLQSLDLRLDRLGESSTRKAKRIKQALEAMVPRIENLRDFQNAILQLGDTLEDVANKARDAWADSREQMLLFALAGSPEGQELQSLLAEQKKATVDVSIRTETDSIVDAQKRLQELQAELVSPFRTRSVAEIESEITQQERAIANANDRIAEINRQARITELQENIDNQKAWISARTQQAKDGFDAEANAYRDMLLGQLQAQQFALARGEIDYATFVRRVKKILGPMSEFFDLSANDELALQGGRNFINAFIEGMKQMRGRARSIMLDILKDLRAFLPGSEPRDKSSPLTKLDESGKGLMSNLADGVASGGRRLLKSLYGELAPIAGIGPNLALRAYPVGGGNGGNTYHVTRNYHLPPGPGGGYEPGFAASQLDKIMQDEGGWGR
jgi:hypothetical protein